MRWVCGSCSRCSWLVSLLGLTLLGLNLLSLHGCVSQAEMRGPLPVRNQHPAQLTVLHLDPAPTSVLPAGGTRWRTDLAYTSLFLSGSNGADSWIMDGEELRAALDVRIGLGGGLELGGQLAGAHTSGGFLDSFIIDYHDAFGFPDQNRSTSPRGDFLVEAVQDATPVWQKRDDGVEWLDLPVHLTWQLLEPGPGRVGMALRGGIELPLGRQERGYGNGEIDFSAGALFEYQTDCLGFTGHIQHTLAGTPDQSRRRRFEFADVTSIGAGVELPLSTDLHALVQVEWETSTLRDLGPRAAARDQMLLWVGGRYRAAPDWEVEVGFGEDLIGLASPDFTAWLAFVWTPGAGERAR